MHKYREMQGTGPKSRVSGLAAKRCSHGGWDLRASLGQPRRARAPEAEAKVSTCSFRCLRSPGPGLQLSSQVEAEQSFNIAGDYLQSHQVTASICRWGGFSRDPHQGPSAQ